MLENQAGAYADIYGLGRGLGDVPESLTFTDFLNRQGPLGQPDPAVMQALVERSRQLLAQSPRPGESETLAAAREDLAENTPRQFGFALGAVSPTVPREFRSSLADLAARNFQNFSLSQGLGAIGNQSFLDFSRPVGAGGVGIVGDQNPGRFRNLASTTADLFSEPERSLSDTQNTFLQELRNNPENQFNIALQGALPNVPAALRGTFSKLAEQAFRRFQNEKGTFANFLPFASQNQFRLLGR